MKTKRHITEREFKKAAKSLGYQDGVVINIVNRVREIQCGKYQLK